MAKPIPCVEPLINARFPFYWKYLFGANSRGIGKDFIRPFWQGITETPVNDNKSSG